MWALETQAGADLLSAARGHCRWYLSVGTGLLAEKVRRLRYVAPKLRVMIVGPHEVERAGLRLLIRDDEDDYVVAEAASGQTALALARDFEPGIAIVDSSVADMPDLALIHFFTRDHPGVQILIYTERCSRDRTVVALREGVRAFVLKSQASKHLLPALRALADHRPYWEGAVDGDVLDELLGSGGRPLATSLTSREWQIVQMAAAGQTSKEMARSIGVSHRTIEAFRATVRRKLGFRNIADLTRYAAQRDTTTT
jgi:DNA-binding NarL/FixJ family response regulator